MFRLFKVIATYCYLKKIQQIFTIIYNNKINIALNLVKINLQGLKN